MNDETSKMTKPQCAGAIFAILAEQGISVTSSDTSVPKLVERASDLIAIRVRTAKHAVKALESLMTAWDEADRGKDPAAHGWVEEATAANGAG